MTDERREAEIRARVADWRDHANTACGDRMWLLTQLDKLRAALSQEERSCLQVIDEREAATDAADKLAYHIATVEEIGEHSNLNDPWSNALEALDAERQQSIPFENLLPLLQVLERDEAGYKMSGGRAVAEVNIEYHALRPKLTSDQRLKVESDGAS